MYRDFILGSNTTGLVQYDGSVVGGEDSSILKGNVIPGQSGILYGSGTATSLYVAPSESIAAWESFFSTVVAAEATQTSTVESSSASTLSLTTSSITTTTTTAV